MRAKLFCRTGELAGRTHHLTDEIVVGRNPAADVVVQSDLISGRHARIHAAEGAFVLEDLGSTNGTWLDGVRVVEPVRLDRLNVITFAKAFDFVFLWEDAAATAKQPSKPAAGAPEPKPKPAEEDPRTRSDMEVLSPLPDLERPETTTAPASEDKPRTQVDLQGLRPLPELQKTGMVKPPPADDDPKTQLDMAAFEMPELESARPKGYRIDVTFSDGRNETFELKEGRQTLGRSDKCDVTLYDPEISRHHATLIVGKTVTVEDAGSSNGTHVDGRKVDTAEIQPGSAFTLGATVTVRLIQR